MVANREETTITVELDDVMSVSFSFFIYFLLVPQVCSLREMKISFEIFYRILVAMWKYFLKRSTKCCLLQTLILVAG